MVKPICIDLYCGLGGWAEGFLAEGWSVIGFDVERHDYGTGGYPGQLVLQDVLTLHGSQFRNADIIVASPPCQAYSYRAMPWKRAKALPPPDNALFDACFRIQREACEAAGRYIPLIVENVKGAQPWVGKARWHYGSFYLWGDVPALMPRTVGQTKMPKHINESIRQGKSPAHWTNPAEHYVGSKNNGGSWFAIESGHSRNPVHRPIPEMGIKMQSPGHYRKPGSGPDWFDGGPAAHASGSAARKAASSQIAKIPFELAAYIARVYSPC